MKLFPAAILHAFLLSSTLADCDDCNNNCGWWYQGCYWDKAIRLCDGKEILPGDGAKILAAQQVLVDRRFFKGRDFRGRTIKFCPLLGGSGVTVNADTIYLDDDFRGKSTLETASLLAHEMYHAVRQFERWGYDKFTCEYGSNLSSGLGRGNPVEKPAYAFQESVDKCIFEEKNCPMQ